MNIKVNNLASDCEVPGINLYHHHLIHVGYNYMGRALPSSSHSHRALPVDMLYWF